jgi:hypothetical protein
MVNGNGRKRKGIEGNVNGNAWKWELADKKFEHIEEGLNKVISGVDKVTTSVESLAKLAEKHDAILFGKAEDLGETGLLMKVKNVDTKVDSLEKSLKKDTRWLVGIGMAIWAVIIKATELFWHK